MLTGTGLALPGMAYRGPDVLTNAAIPKPGAVGASRAGPPEAGSRSPALSAADGET